MIPQSLWNGFVSQQKASTRREKLADKYIKKKKEKKKRKKKEKKRSA